MRRLDAIVRIFSRHALMRRASAAGTSRGDALTGAGSRSRIAAMSPALLDAVNAGVPVSIS